jgi:hypothetical protein
MCYKTSLKDNKIFLELGTTFAGLIIAVLGVWIACSGQTIAEQQAVLKELEIKNIRLIPKLTIGGEAGENGELSIYPLPGVNFFPEEFYFCISECTDGEAKWLAATLDSYLSYDDQTTTTHIHVQNFKSLLCNLKLQRSSKGKAKFPKEGKDEFYLSDVWVRWAVFDHIQKYSLRPSLINDWQEGPIKCKG